VSISLAVPIVSVSCGDSVCLQRVADVPKVFVHVCSIRESGDDLKKPTALHRHLFICGMPAAAAAGDSHGNQHKVLHCIAQTPITDQGCCCCCR
jgi:hypothetical protein